MFFQTAKVNKMRQNGLYIADNSSLRIARVCTKKDYRSMSLAELADFVIDISRHRVKNEQVI